MSKRYKWIKHILNSKVASIKDRLTAAQEKKYSDKKILKIERINANTEFCFLLFFFLEFNVKTVLKKQNVATSGTTDIYIYIQ